MRHCHGALRETSGAVRDAGGMRASRLDLRPGAGPQGHRMAGLLQKRRRTGAGWSPETDFKGRAASRQGALHFAGAAAMRGVGSGIPVTSIEPRVQVGVSGNRRQAHPSPRLSVTAASRRHAPRAEPARAPEVGVCRQCAIEPRVRQVGAGKPRPAQVSG